MPHSAPTPVVVLVSYMPLARLYFGVARRPRRRWSRKHHSAALLYSLQTSIDHRDGCDATTSLRRPQTKSMAPSWLLYAAAALVIIMVTTRIRRHLRRKKVVAFLSIQQKGHHFPVNQKTGHNLPFNKKQAVVSFQPKNRSSPPFNQINRYRLPFKQKASYRLSCSTKLIVRSTKLIVRSTKLTN